MRRGAARRSRYGRNRDLRLLRHGVQVAQAEARSGGVNISGGAVTIGGDIVGGSKRVIVTGESPAVATIWDEPDTSDDEGVSIEGDGIQVQGDVVGGSVVKIVPSRAATRLVGEGEAVVFELRRSPSP